MRTNPLLPADAGERVWRQLARMSSPYSPCSFTCAATDEVGDEGPLFMIQGKFLSQEKWEDLFKGTLEECSLALYGMSEMYLWYVREQRRIENRRLREELVEMSHGPFCEDSCECGAKP